MQSVRPHNIHVPILAINEHVTAAFSDHASWRNNKSRRVQVIGFAPWGLVRGAEQLLAGVTGVDVPYYGHAHQVGDKLHRSSASQLLGEGHTGFVLVDDGTFGRRSSNTDIMRRTFENFLRTLPVRSAVGRSIPMVCLLVNGREAALNAFQDYVSNQPFAPVVACADTGGVADLVTTIYEKQKDEE